MNNMLGTVRNSQPNCGLKSIVGGKRLAPTIGDAPTNGAGTAIPMPIQSP